MTKLSVVIARYDEDLSWLECFKDLSDSMDLSVHFFVYDKGFLVHPLDVESLRQRLSSFAEAVHHVALPNVGREGHTYLHHMIHAVAPPFREGHYTMFLQGKIADHIGCPIETYVRNMLQDAERHGVSSSTARAHDFGGNSATYGFRITHWQAPLEPASTAPFGAWFESRLCKKFPDPVIWWAGALFCVHDPRIGAARSKGILQNVMKDLDVHNPEAGHFLERAWLYVFA